MRRFSWVLVVLAGCGGKAASSGPAWPKSAGWVTPASAAEDGGESIEPRTGGVAAVESSEGASDETTVEIDFDPTLEDPTLEEVPPVEEPAAPPPEEVYVPEEAIIIEGEAPP